MLYIINSVIAKICHDLIGPLGTAQMALENKEYKILENTLESAVTKLEIFRSIFSQNQKNDVIFRNLNAFIKENNLNCDLSLKVEPIFAGLIFFLLQKMLASSSLKLKQSQHNFEIELENVNLAENEIAILKGSSDNFDTYSISPYLAWLQYGATHSLEITKIKEKQWIIKILSK